MNSRGFDVIVLAQGVVASSYIFTPPWRLQSLEGGWTLVELKHLTSVSLFHHLQKRVLGMALFRGFTENNLFKAPT